MTAALCCPTRYACHESLRSCGKPLTEHAAGQEILRVKAHQVVSGDWTRGRDQPVGLPEAGAFQGVTDAAGVGEPRLGHAPAKVVAEDGVGLHRQAVPLAVKY